MSVPSVILLFLFFSLTTSLPTTESDRSSRIVNGFVIDISEIPYHATVWRKSIGGWAYTCGGAVITTRALLTAGHCVQSSKYNPSSMRVIVGTSYRLSGGDAYDISKVYVHENYSTITLEYDIAMLVTSKKVSFGKNVDAVFIAEPSTQSPVGKRALVSGFGTTSYQGSVPTALLAANVEIVSQEACSRAYRNIATIASGMICASADNPPRDACQGDSGGPLVADKTLIGIVSWGEGCANVTYPGVYTRVSTHYSWIVEKLTLI